MYKSKVNFILPDFTLCLPFYRQLLELRDMYPEMFYENVNFRAIYGNFDGCIWNGGRTNHGIVFDSITVESIISTVAYMGIPLRLTFTNPILEETDLYDRYGNMILEKASMFPDNEVLVSTDLMKNYIKSKSNIKLVKSIVGSRDIDYDPSDDFVMTVLRKHRNNDWDYLKSIPLEHRSKIEILCNEECPDTCMNSYNCYEQLGRGQLYRDDGFHNCMKKHDLYAYELLSNKFYVSPEMINSYLDLGINNFKLSGRGYYMHVVEFVTKYLIKPEYQMDVRLKAFLTYTDNFQGGRSK